MPRMQTRRSDGVYVSKMEDEIRCGGELRVGAASIVGGVVVGMFEAQLRLVVYRVAHRGQVAGQCRHPLPHASGDHRQIQGRRRVRARRGVPAHAATAAVSA